MIDAVWLQVLKRIPPDKHDSLSIVTTTGAELVIQQIFKMERDFLVLRARTAGTGDLGRSIILPFAQIDFMAFGGKLTEEEVMKIFGEPMPEIALPQPMMQYQPAAIAAPAVRPEPAPAPAKETFAFAAASAAAPAPAAQQPEPTVTEPAPAEAPAPAKPGQISKTVLLARLRERLAEKR